jgi:hypothetical protein
LNLTETYSVRIELPVAEGAAALLQIAPEKLTDTNEDAVTVVPRAYPLAISGGMVSVELPKHSISAVLWPSDTGAPPRAR